MILEKGKNSAFYSGLSKDEVLRSRKLHGCNVLTPAKKTPLWKLYLEKYSDPIIIILLVAALLSLFLSFFGGGVIETLGILIAIFLATTIGFIFEVDAKRKFNILTAFSEDSPVKVRRNDETIQVPRQDVVVGDIVLIEAGDEVPADGDLLEAIGLIVNESSLTGEPYTEKSINNADNANLASHAFTYPVNKVYRSSMVMDGRGVMRITTVGDSTEIGRVAHKSMETTAVETPLNKQLKKLAKLISFWGSIISATALVVFICHDLLTNNYWNGLDVLAIIRKILNYVMVAVTLIVMAVPEGLPMAITLSLALNMRRMLRSNNLVRKLHACETMGAVTVICTDKTGTLTQNKMVVESIIHNPMFIIKSQQLTQADLFAYAIAVNTTADCDKNSKGIGNPTEVALLAWLQSQGYDYRELRQRSIIINQLPFSTERKYMSTEVEIFGKRHTFIKGAPEVIFNLVNANNNELQSEVYRFASQGMRTLAFAVDDHLQAIVAISDPLRQDVPAAIEQCKKAGIEIKIVTGDNAETAIEIARQTGLWNADIPDDCQITGSEFQELTDAEALEIVPKIIVMSRARPNDKQRLVQILQQLDEVVAVTGDGTNDAPALNYAHVGLSLGSGTSVAKEASDITLLDDSFGSIARAVMWGRSLYKNLQRFIFFQMTVNIVALSLSVFGTLIGRELPLTVTQILWVNLIMDTLAAMALSSLSPSKEVMNDKPRKQSDSILSRRMILNISVIGFVMFVALFSLLYYCEHYYKHDLLEGMTIFFTTFVMLQFWNFFNAKRLGSRHSAFWHIERDKVMLLVLLIIMICQWLIVTFGGEIFRTIPLSWQTWMIIFFSTSPILLFGYLCKH